MQNNDVQQDRKNRPRFITVLASVAAIAAVVWLALNCPTCH
ncbi:MAG: hypothetical protein ACE5DZ_03020 [Mariprofundus sp.]